MLSSATKTWIDTQALRFAMFGGGLHGANVQVAADIALDQLWSLCCTGSGPEGLDWCSQRLDVYRELQRAMRAAVLREQRANQYTLALGL